MPSARINGSRSPSLPVNRTPTTRSWRPPTRGRMNNHPRGIQDEHSRADRRGIVAETVWADVDRYLTDLFVPRDAALSAALDASAAAGLPPVNVSPTQGKFLMLMASLIGAQRILEIGTLGGYSTIWLARGLSSGEIGRAHV